MVLTYDAYSETLEDQKEKEDKLKSRWPWNSIGDYYIISLRKV